MRYLSWLLIGAILMIGCIRSDRPLSSRGVNKINKTVIAGNTILPGASVSQSLRVVPVIADSGSVKAIEELSDTLLLISRNAFEVCFDSGYLYNTCASVIVRDSQFTDVATFSAHALRYWDRQMYSNGLLVLLGFDSVGNVWSIEFTRSDASAAVFADLVCRNRTTVLKQQSILNSMDDCPDPEAATIEELMSVVRTKMNIAAGEFQLNQLHIDSVGWKIPLDNRNEITKPGEYGPSIYGEKLAISTSDGTYSWFFEQTPVMCWFHYDWQVWYR